MADQETKRTLIKKCIEAKETSYSPYSKFRVGAAILLKNGDIHTGCNVENASYGLSTCAERTAIFKAVSERPIKEDTIEIVACAVSTDSSEAISPCGACRQVLAEFSTKKTLIILVHPEGAHQEYVMDELLPMSFGKQHLEAMQKAIGK